MYIKYSAKYLIPVMLPDTGGEYSHHRIHLVFNPCISSSSGHLMEFYITAKIRTEDTFSYNGFKPTV